MRAHASNICIHTQAPSRTHSALEILHFTNLKKIRHPNHTHFHTTPLLYPQPIMNTAPQPRADPRHCLVTGGAGYIGQHVVIELLRRGWHVTILDNLVTSTAPSCDTLARLAFVERSALQFHKGDVCDPDLGGVFRTHGPFAMVIHLAALKSVQESIQNPAEYKRVNVGGLQNVLDWCARERVHRFVFSSSATVYGDTCPEAGYGEADALSLERHSHSYGWTKRKGELMVEAASRDNPNGHYVSLRYFNPMGNHESGEIGEDYINGQCPNVMVQLAKAAMGRREHFCIFGREYSGSPDGTAVRDYVDVRDLACAHIEIVDRLERPGYFCHNVGTGKGSSVQTLVDAFRDIATSEFKVVDAPPREGDMGVCFANCASTEWRASLSLASSIRSVWKRCHYLDNRNIGSRTCSE